MTGEWNGYWAYRQRCESETTRGTACQRFTRVTYDGVYLCATHAPATTSPLSDLDRALVVCGAHGAHGLALWLIHGDTERLRAADRMTPIPSPWYRGDKPTHHLTTDATLSCGAPTGADVLATTSLGAVSCTDCIRDLHREGIDL